MLIVGAGSKLSGGVSLAEAISGVAETTHDPGVVEAGGPEDAAVVVVVLDTPLQSDQSSYIGGMWCCRLDSVGSHHRGVQTRSQGRMGVSLN